MTVLWAFWEGFNGYPPDVWNQDQRDGVRESYEHGRRTAASIAARKAAAAVSGEEPRP